MNDWIYIGKIVNTHGIKGELRILSDFEKKEIVFQKGFQIYIGKEKRIEKIASYRHHKNFEMICYENISNINEVINDKNKNVYIRRQDLKMSEGEYLTTDLIDFEVWDNEKNIGKISDIVYNKASILLKVNGKNNKSFYIPKNEVFIKNIDFHLKRINTQNTKGLII